MSTSVYKAQCKTFSVAREYCNDFRAATPRGMIVKPPYCLRIVPQYRTSEMQAFRDKIASIVKERRAT